MSSDEESASEVEEVSEDETPPPKKPVSAPKKQMDIPAGLDEASMELLDANKKDRDRMEEEINELRARAEKRKKQRAIEDKRHAKERADEDERRKALEEEKKRKREEDDQNRQHERAEKMAEFEKLKTPGGPNFVISKKDGEEEEGRDVNRKSKEQLEAEKKAILGQRIKALEISGFDTSKLSEKAKELHKMIYKLEDEKYDLEKLFKTHQADLMELAEQARKANKVGKGGLKRVQQGDDVDMIQARFTGAPAKIEMYSKYERQKDKREYGEKKTHFCGPQYLHPAERIKAAKAISWDEEGMPIYGEGGAAPAEAQPEPVEAA